jgi:glutamate dehydrogenase
MPIRAEGIRTDLVERAVALLPTRVAPERVGECERFVRLLYSRVPPDEIVGESPDNLCGAALSLWGFAQQREPGQVKLRMFAPNNQQHGFSCAHTVIEIINDDMPFLVDSTTAELSRLETEVCLVIHPLVLVRRDSRHCMVGSQRMGEDSNGLLRESFMQIHINLQPVERHAEIERQLLQVLAEVRVAVSDWQEMRGRLHAIVDDLEQAPPTVLPPEEVEVGKAFLRWLDDDHYTYLGYREYSFEGEGDRAVGRIVPGTGLGLLRDESYNVFDGLRNLELLPEDVQAFVREPRLLRITKANSRSRVHRPVYMDTVAVKSIDPVRGVIGERLLVGLFTSEVYSAEVSMIPILRQKVERTLEQAGFRPRSHDGKQLLNILESYPRDELFQISQEDLLATATGILDLQDRRRIAVFPRLDPFKRFVSCLVFVPRDGYDTELRLKIQDALARAWQGRVVAYYTWLSDAPLARLHFIVKTSPELVRDVDVVQLEAELTESARSWDDRLLQALIAESGEVEGRERARRFRNVFPPAYQHDVSPADGLLDLRGIEAALRSGDISMRLFRPLGTASSEVRFKIFGSGRAAPLAAIIPMLENMGLRVVNEVPYNLDFAGAGNCWIRDFYMESMDGAAIDLEAVRESFCAAFALIWRGDMENDGFNRLVVCARMEPRRVQLLRAYAKHLLQAGVPWSQSTIEQTLGNNCAITALLVELFTGRFDPQRVEKSDEAQLRATIETRLEGVASLDEDRILRRFLEMVGATLRTNFYQHDDAGRPKPYISFKLDSEALLAGRIDAKTSAPKCSG